MPHFVQVEISDAKGKLFSNMNSIQWPAWPPTLKYSYMPSKQYEILGEISETLW